MAGSVLRGRDKAPRGSSESTSPFVGAARTDHVQFDSYYVAPAVMPLARVQGSSSGKFAFLL
jgi:hypothetical protein